MFFVYKITNLINNKVYIGKTNNIDKRYHAHISTALANKRTSRDCVKFYRSLRKHGIINFTYPEVLGTYENEDFAYESEKQFIEQYDSFRNGLNACPGGRGVFGSGEKSSFYIYKDVILAKRAAKKNSIVKITERFFSYVDKTEDCWIWTGGKMGEYGGFCLRNKQIRAHAAMWEINFGSAPDGYLIAHICPNTLCVNPQHLELVTRKELNTRNNRHVSRQGSNNSQSKLTEDKVKKIISSYESGSVSHASLAKEYGVAKTTIANILSGKKWKLVC